MAKPDRQASRTADNPFSDRGRHWDEYRRSGRCLIEPEDRPPHQDSAMAADILIDKEIHLSVELPPDPGGGHRRAHDAKSRGFRPSRAGLTSNALHELEIVPA